MDQELGEPAMHRFGVWLMFCAAACVVLGLLVGFGAMFSGRDEIAKLMLGLVPVGFVVGFAGVVTTLLYPPPK
jgi:hypothetical protein